jgi:hypothetical protein
MIQHCNDTALLYSETECRGLVLAFMLILGSFRVQISIREPAILIGGLRDLPQSLETKAMNYPSTPAHSLIILPLDAAQSC